MMRMSTCMRLDSIEEQAEMSDIAETTINKLMDSLRSQLLIIKVQYLRKIYYQHVIG